MNPAPNANTRTLSTRNRSAGAHRPGCFPRATTIPENPAKAIANSTIDVSDSCSLNGGSGCLKANRLRAVYSSASASPSTPLASVRNCLCRSRTATKRPFSSRKRSQRTESPPSPCSTVHASRSNRAGERRVPLDNRGPGKCWAAGLLARVPIVAATSAGREAIREEAKAEDLVYHYAGDQNNLSSRRAHGCVRRRGSRSEIWPFHRVSRSEPTKQRWRAYRHSDNHRKPHRNGETEGEEWFCVSRARGPTRRSSFPGTARSDRPVVKSEIELGCLSDRRRPGPRG